MIDGSDELMERMRRNMETRALTMDVPPRVLEDWSLATRVHRGQYEDRLRVLVDEYEQAALWPRMWYVVRVQQLNIEYLASARALRVGLSFVDRACWRRLDTVWVLEPREVLGDD